MGPLRILTAVVLGVHGLIHMLGVGAYLRLASIPELPYRTTVLNGILDLGPTGIAVYGALWGVVTVGFIVTAIGLFARWNWYRAALLCVTLLSLVVTALAWTVAYTGVVVNLAVLAGLWLTGPRSRLTVREAIYGDGNCE